MSSQLPYPLPGKYDPSGPFRNPGETNPLPAPADMPTACWFGTGVPCIWTDVSAVPQSIIQLQWIWRSPIIDMRPDTRNVVPNAISNGSPGRVSGLPMWNPAAQLWVQLENPAAPGLSGIRAQSLSGFQVLATERAHVSDPNRVRDVVEPEDVTAQFTAMGPSAVCAWYPVGDGNPIRYYQLELTFNMLKNFQSPEPVPGINPAAGNPAPVFTLVPAMY